MDPDDTSAPVDPTPGPSQADTAPDRILLVEDSDVDAARITHLLAEGGRTHHLTHVRTLEDACRHLARQRTDCVLLNISLPGSDDLTAVTAVRAVSPAVPMVVLTATGQQPLGLDAIRLGAQDYVAKDDVDARRLWRTVEYALRRTLVGRRAHHQATHDLLTGLGNRLMLLQGLHGAVGRLFHAKAGLALLFLDVDRFRDVNRTMGHHAGDDLLILLAERIRALMGPDALAIRLGGDEFAVLYEEVTPPQAEDLARRMRDALSAPLRLAGRDVDVAVTVGLACTADQNVDPEALLHEADAAMYAAKGHHRLHRSARSHGGGTR